jgi:hypothetical protein
MCGRETRQASGMARGRMGWAAAARSHGEKAGAAAAGERVDWTIACARARASVPSPGLPRADPESSPPPAALARGHACCPSTAGVAASQPATDVGPLSLSRSTHRGQLVARAAAAAAHGPCMTRGGSLVWRLRRRGGLKAAPPCTQQTPRPRAPAPWPWAFSSSFLDLSSSSSAGPAPTVRA